jgi:hypothetical protein
MTPAQPPARRLLIDRQPAALPAAAVAWHPAAQGPAAVPLAALLLPCPWAPLSPEEQADAHDAAAIVGASELWPPLARSIADHLRRGEFCHPLAWSQTMKRAVNPGLKAAAVRRGRGPQWRLIWPVEIRRAAGDALVWQAVRAQAQPLPSGSVWVEMGEQP